MQVEGGGGSPPRSQRDAAAVKQFCIVWFPQQTQTPGASSSRIDLFFSFHFIFSAMDPEHGQIGGDDGENPKQSDDVDGDYVDDNNEYGDGDVDGDYDCGGGDCDGDAENKESDEV